MKCSICSRVNIEICNCSNCQAIICILCVGIDIMAFSRMTTVEKITWTCFNCQESLKSRFFSGAQKLDNTKRDEFNRNMHTIVRDYSDFKNETKENLKTSLVKFKELEDKLVNLETKIDKIQNGEEYLSGMRQVTELVDDYEQKMRNNNLEIRGLPQMEYENLDAHILTIFRKTRMPLTLNDIDFCTRVKTFDPTRPKNVIIRFINKYKKQMVLLHSRRVQWQTRDFGIPGEPRPVLIRHHLTIKNKNLMKLVRAEAIKKDYEFVWVNDGRILVQKDVYSQFMVIKCEQDLLQM